MPTSFQGLLGTRLPACLIRNYLETFLTISFWVSDRFSTKTDSVKQCERFLFFFVQRWIIFNNPAQSCIAVSRSALMLSSPAQRSHLVDVLLGLKWAWFRNWTSIFLYAAFRNKTADIGIRLRPGTQPRSQGLLAGGEKALGTRLARNCDASHILFPARSVWHTSYSCRTSRAQPNLQGSVPRYDTKKSLWNWLDWYSVRFFRLWPVTRVGFDCFRTGEIRSFCVDTEWDEHAKHCCTL